VQYHASHRAPARQRSRGLRSVGEVLAGLLPGVDIESLPPGELGALLAPQLAENVPPEPRRSSPSTAPRYARRRHSRPRRPRRAFEGPSRS